jgi:hypothetical protein
MRNARRAGEARANAPPSLNLLDWHRLSPEERTTIHTMLAELEAYHRGFLQAKRPRKHHLNTLVLQLAEFFIRFSEQKERSALSLEAAEASHFIQFCHLVLAPLNGKGKPFDPSEVTPEALSERWRRVIETSRAKAAKVKPQPRGARRLAAGRKQPKP